MVDGTAAFAPWMMTRIQDLNVLHVDDATQWAAPLDARVVSGDTLIFDFVYFLHPVNISLSAQLSHARVIIGIKQQQSFKRMLLTTMNSCYCHHLDNYASCSSVNATCRGPYSLFVTPCHLSASCYQALMYSNVSLCCNWHCEHVCSSPA